MELVHHGVKIVLDDDWWAEARMFGFRPRALSYSTDERVRGRRIFQVDIRDIAPVRRAPGIPIFNDSHDTGLTARERVVAILDGFRDGAVIPPVEVVTAEEGSPQSFKLTHGAHRLYCSLAAGFTHVPAVIGFDINAPFG
jgi:hypothetical protein